MTVQKFPNNEKLVFNPAIKPIEMLKIDDAARYLMMMMVVVEDGAASVLKTGHEPKIWKRLSWLSEGGDWSNNWNGRGLPLRLIPR